MKVALNDPKLCYSGRIDWRKPEHPEWIFPATSLLFRFCGTKAVLTVENKNACWNNYVGAIIDGSQKCWKLNQTGETRILLIEETEAVQHEILVFKRQDSCHELILKELQLSEKSVLLLTPPKPDRKIEVYGDSVSAGEVSEAIKFVGKPDPDHHGEYSNSWYSYAWIAARRLQAQLHNISQGGIPLLNGTGWVAPPVYPGMEFMWDKLHYHPQLGEPTPWDFSQYTPHLVIAAIGQNDSNPYDYMKTNSHGIRAAYWKYRYQKWIQEIRKKYPYAVILLTTTILEHDPRWDEAIQEVCQAMQDDRIRHFLYSKNGCKTPGHVRIPEAEEMAEELVNYIEALELPIWEV